MAVFEVKQAQLFHCGRMARILKAEKADCLDVDIHAELRDAFNASLFCKIWLVDGQLMALGGLVGSALESTGYVWLALSKRARKYPVETFKEARRQLTEMMLMKTELAAVIVAGDESAARFAVHLGFIQPNKIVPFSTHARIKALQDERGEPLANTNVLTVPITYRPEAF